MHSVFKFDLIKPNQVVKKSRKIPHSFLLKAKLIKNSIHSKKKREFGASETDFFKYSEFSCITTIFYLNSKINFEKNVELLESSINELKKRDFFLRSKVIHDSKTDEFYLQEEDESDSHSINNYKFLDLSRIDTENRSKIDDIVDLLAIKDTEAPFDFKNDLLWRMIFLKLDQNSHRNCFKYGLIVSCHHAIMESRSIQQKVIELFGIVQSMYNNQYVPQFEYKITPTLEELIKQNCINEQNLRLVDEFYFESNELLNKINSYRPEVTQNEPQMSKQNDDQTIHDLNGNRFITVNELRSKYHTEMNTRFKRFKIESSVFSKLVQKCKQESTKVNACLNIILGIVMKSIYEKLNIPPQDFVYLNSIALRNQFLPSSTDPFSSFGYLIGRYINKHQYASLDLSLMQFWDLVRHESSEMHMKLDKWEHLNTIDWSKATFDQQIKVYHYFLTNIADLRNFSQSHEEDSSIKIEERYDMGYISNSFKSGLFFFCVCTIENELYVSLNYSNRMIQNAHVVNLVCDLFRETICKLVS
jgi:hypothetical protein